MEENIEKLPTEEVVKNETSEEITSIDNNKLSMDELITRISLLSENENPYSVSKEIEEIKSIFYFKLKAEQKEDTPKAETIEVSENGEPTEVEEEKETQKTLHPLEIKFKHSFSRYKKIKFDYRKQRELEESKNLKIKLVREYAKNMGENCLKMEDYLVNSIMKNKINKAKDVEYDIALGVITNIPNLYFNDRSKNYSLKNNDFRKTILKNFSPKNIGDKKN